MRSNSYLDNSLPVPLSGPSGEDPIVAVPLNLDRLRVAVHIMSDLLK